MVDKIKKGPLPENPKRDPGTARPWPKDPSGDPEFVRGTIDPTTKKVAR